MYAVCKTDIGQLRSMNQDVCRAGVFPDGGAWSVVCDGMGGASGGNIASDIACEVITAAILSSYTSEMPPEGIRTMLLTAAQEANTAVRTRAEEDSSLRGMGTTIVAAVAAHGSLHVVHAGDSRCYLISEGSVRQVTTDHSYVQQLVESGAISAEEARFHPQKNLITRVIGVHQEVECDYNCVEFKEGDIAISCTDGLSDYLERDALLLFTNNFSDEQLAEELIAFANSEGGRDNITVAVIYNR